MSHIKKEAPTGYIYRYKNAENEYARIAHIGSGRSEDDYEKIPEAEYQAKLEEESGKAGVVI